MKKVLISLLVIVVIILGIYFYFFHLSPIKKNDPLNAVPDDAAVILSFDDPFKQWNKLTDNDIWNYLKTNTYMADVGYQIDSINTEIKANEMLWELLASRPVVISVHKIRRNEFDYLYTIDLQKATQFNFIKDYIDQLTDKDTKVLTRDYHGGEVITLEFSDSPTRVYMNVTKNLLIVSTTHTLIEKSIDQREEPKIARDFDFIDVSRYMDEGYITMYLQHQYLSEYLKQWVDDDNATALDILKPLKYTGINFDMDDKHLSLTGLSNVIDTVPSLISALKASGKGNTRLPEIAPENTSFFMSMGFDDATDFYGHFENNLTQSKEGEEYLANKEKLEKFLDISIEKHFLSWIDDEIGLIQLHSSNQNTAADFAIAIRHNDKETARENLDFIKEQIRKKTPVKFRGIEYKGYQINFLSIKGFFKIILGKAFSKIDKPYYTILDDYVVFSNTPKTLGKIIDNYIDATTLSANEAFNDYMAQFKDESSLFVYINPEQLITDSKKFLAPKHWKNVNANRAYIERFPMIGMQFLPEGKLLANEIIFEYMDNRQIEDWNHLFTEDMETTDILSTADDKDEEAIAVEDILPDDLNAKELNDRYTNGQLKYEVSLKNGMKHGTYREYDSLGNVIIKGRYKNDEKSGTWKYYNSEGDVVKKERY